MIVNASILRYSKVNPIHHAFFFAIGIQMIKMKYNNETY